MVEEEGDIPYSVADTTKFKKEFDWNPKYNSLNYILKTALEWEKILSKMKILQVIPKLGYGGAETGCYDLAHFLYEKDCKSFIITSGGQLLKYVKKNKVKIFRLPVHSKNIILMLFNTLIISLIVLIYNIDIVHARSRAPAWSCLWACFLTRRKFVTTFHGTYNFSNAFKKFYNSVMVKI